MAKLCLVATSLLISSANLPALTTSEVWINEIHYDNAGGDTGEFVEIAATELADLTGLELTLYNGSNSSRKAYDSFATTEADLDTLIEGIRYLVFDIAGIQNGAPDGLSLSAPGFLQFLSYEGVFEALDGPAAGITSSDIGVAENGSPLGHSLQLTGKGTSYSDFTWIGPTQNTRGYANNGQTFGVPDTSTTLGLLSVALFATALVKRRLPKLSES